MEVKEIFGILKNEIHSTVFATVDESGLPQTCVIDIMLCGDNSLYFITAKGKTFYDRLMLRKYVAVSGMKGRDTLSTAAISVRGKIRNIGNALLPRVFAENPYMADIYKSEDSRTALEVFQLYEGEGEYFDLSCLHIQLRLACAELMKRQGHEEAAGSAKITPAYNLPSRYILHTVGPIIQGTPTKIQYEQLAGCYRSCLELADSCHLKSVAFCCISTGEFHFPNWQAAEIAVRTVYDYMQTSNSIDKVIFNVYKGVDYEIYTDLFAKNK